MYTTYDIFDDMLDLRNIINNYFTEMPVNRRRYEFPLVNLYEKDDAVEIKALAPGLRVEDINLQLIDNNLIIEGEKKSDYEDKPYIRKERYFGKLQKSIKLPYRVDVNNIQASFKNGMLYVKLAKSEDAKPKRIEIN